MRPLSDVLSRAAAAIRLDGDNRRGCNPDHRSSASTRPIHVRTARTLLTTVIVTSAAILGLWVGHDAEFAEIMPFLMLMQPF